MRMGRETRARQRRRQQAAAFERARFAARRVNEKSSARLGKKGIAVLAAELLQAGKLHLSRYFR